MPAAPRPNKKSQEIYEFIMGKSKKKNTGVKNTSVEDNNKTSNTPKNKNNAKGLYYER
jgi:hypothetical protein